MLTDKKTYCSLDIETSGFDPISNEILEVGFVKFSLEGRKLKILEEWTKVFKPSKVVSPQILALTGIKQKELDDAPRLAEFRETLQDKLGQSVILGHNIIFDIKFLEAAGIKFSGQTIDTLDMVQWLLPTHHSYNLENLMYTFGIKHTEAHRALADSRATLQLLEKLLGIYGGLPEKLKLEINKLVKDQQFFWKELLATNFPSLKFADFAIRSTGHFFKNQTKKFKLEAGNFYNFPLGEDYYKTLSSAGKQDKILLVLSKPQDALDLYRQGLVQQAIFLPELMFNQTKFQKKLNSKSLSPEEVKFLLKVLVWKSTNWQTESLLDLNLSFFGGQFKDSINGGEIKENKLRKNIACDMQTFLYLSENRLYKNYLAVVSGLNEFESAITSTLGTRASWSHINFLLKSFFNPETGSGLEKFKQPVEEAMGATDLFFGLTGALLQSDPPEFLYFKITEDALNDNRYKKIGIASQNYLEKLTMVNKKLKSKDIEKFIVNLEDFFKAQSGRVKWIEMSLDRCVFSNMPLDITADVQNYLKAFPSVSFADSLDNKVLPKFFLHRLGLSKLIRLAPLPKPTPSQGDLFTSLKKVKANGAKAVNYSLWPQTADEKTLLDILSKKDLPTAIVFGGSLQVKQFYEHNYQDLKKEASVLVQASSGGSNKIFRNFAINPKSVLLVTDKFILKALSSQAAVETIKQLPVSTVVLCRLPFEQFTHPYQEALSAALPNAFQDYSLPRALYNFHKLVSFFYTPALKDIYVLDAKLSKSYAQVFIDYFKSLPNAKSV